MGPFKLKGSNPGPLSKYWTFPAPQAASGLRYGESCRPMLTFSRILCAVDHSEPGRAAFQHALSLAKAHGALLSLVFAIPRSVRFNWRALERIRLMAEFRRIAVAEGVSLSISAQQGDPAGIILLHARARKHDAIVIGMPDQSALERLRFGSIAERVIAGAPCPTFVVRSSENGRVEDAFSHILCPVNVSPASESAVKSAMKLLRRGGQKLTLLHVGPLQGTEYCTKAASATRA